MVELKLLALGYGEAYEKKTFQNFNDPKEKSEFVNRKKKPSPTIQCFLQVWLLAPATGSHTHFVAEAQREGAVPCIANHIRIRWLYPTTGTGSFPG